MDNKVFKEICDSVVFRVEYADERGISQWFNRAAYKSGKRKKTDIGRPLEECHSKETTEKIKFMYDAFRNGRRTPFVVKKMIGEKRAVIHFYPIFSDGVFRGCSATIIFPDELLKGFPCSDFDEIISPD